ncbi:hypothetical protein Tco_0610502 [Tanacetum coccineum]
MVFGNGTGNGNNGGDNGDGTESLGLVLIRWMKRLQLCITSQLSGEISREVCNMYFTRHALRGDLWGDSHQEKPSELMLSYALNHGRELVEADGLRVYYTEKMRSKNDMKPELWNFVE